MIYRAQHSVLFNTIKSSHFIKIIVSELGLLDHFTVESAFQLHHEKEHLVVGASREEDFACVQLIQGASHGPNVNGGIVRYAHNYEKSVRDKRQVRRLYSTNFWGTVKPTNKIGCNLVFRGIRSGAQVA